MEIITTGHDQAHAASEWFSAAHTSDRRYYWYSGMDGYVVASAALTGLTPDEGRTTRTVYLQYPDTDVPPAVAAEMRAFWRELHEIRERRHHERNLRELDEALAAAAQARTAESEAFAKARETGQPVFLWGSECCNDPECNFDYVYAMPDGRINRVHQG